MRILQINSVYKVGSTGKIVADNADVLRAWGHEVFTCYGVGDDHIDAYSRKICGDTEHKVNAFLARVDGIPFGGVYLSNARLARVIQEYKPDVVHVHCVNSFTLNIYLLFKFLAKNNLKTVATCHAEFFHTGSCGHAYECEKWVTGCHNCKVYRQETASWWFDRSATAWKKMRDAFQSFSPENIAITAVSPWLAERAGRSGILGRFGVSYVPNGTDTKIFHYVSDTRLIERESYNKVVLFVAPYFNLDNHDLKGGRLIPLLAEMNQDIKFVVVASRFEGTLTGMPRNVQLWGRAKNQNELAQLYSDADITLILSRRETFSMVTAESLCCGTPVVGFKAGGPESIAMHDYSLFVEYGDLEALSTAIRKFHKSEIEKDEVSRKAIHLYSKENMAKSYFAEYEKLINKSSC